MKTKVGASGGTAGARPGRPRSLTAASVREHLPGLVAVCLAGGAVAGFFLALYWAKHYPMPIGWDTPRYLDQTQFVAAHGLAGVPHRLPPPIKTLPSRGAFPIVMLTLASLFTTNALKMSAVVPPAVAAATALAAGALLSSSFRRGAWELAAAATIVGTSVVVVRLMAPETYTDNLFAAAIFMAALVPLVWAVREGRGFVAALVLLAAGGIAHGPSFAVVMTALGLTALVLAPASWRSWRRGEARVLATPTVRIAGLVAGSGLLTAAGIFGLLRASPDTPKLSRGELVKKLRQDLPLYRFWLTAPLAVAGAAVLARAGLARPSPAPDGGEVATGRLTARVLLTILLSWTAVSVAGVVLFEVGRNSPAHRFLSFLLPLPLLVAVAVLAGGRWVARRRRALGAAAVALAVLGLGMLGWWTLFVDLAGPARGVEWIDKGKVQDALTAGAYLDAAKVPLTAPVVFVIDDGGPNPLSYVPEMTYILRSVLTADRIPHAFFYVGNPDRYLAGEPTLRDRPSTYDANEDRFWPTIQRILPLRPVALVLSSYNPLYAVEAARHPDWLVAPGVLAPNGPRPAAAVAQPPIPTGPTTVPQGVVLGAGTLVALTLIGVGWAAALLPAGVRPFEALALSPAFGVAFLLLAGVAWDAVGLRLTGTSGALVPVVTAAVGGGAALARPRRVGAGGRADPRGPGPEGDAPSAPA